MKGETYGLLFTHSHAWGGREQVSIKRAPAVTELGRPRVNEPRGRWDELHRLQLCDSWRPQRSQNGRNKNIKNTHKVIGEVIGDLSGVPKKSLVLCLGITRSPTKHPQLSRRTGYIREAAGRPNVTNKTPNLAASWQLRGLWTTIFRAWIDLIDRYRCITIPKHSMGLYTCRPRQTPTSTTPGRNSRQSGLAVPNRSCLTIGL